MAKKFRIHKKFEIHEEPTANGRHRWLKQPDAHSCGYYLVHNAHPYLEIPNYEGNPEGVFEAVNNLRRQNSEEPLPRDRNLPSPNLAGYFSSKGFRVEQLSNPHLDTKTIDDTLATQDYGLMYLSSHGHYTGIVKDQNRLLYLDSLTNRSSVISPDEARNRLVGSLGQESNGRYNIVGIVKRPQKTFRIVSL
jgi:hypothetical protein